MASTYLTRTQGTPTSDDIGTYSFWLKRGTLDKNNEYIVQNYVDGSNYGYFRFKSDNQFQHYSSGGGDWERRTNRLFRDTNAWYHIVLRIDTTQSTASDRVRIYINGVEETSFSTETNASQNVNNKLFASGGTLRIGYVSYGTATYFDGCLSHVHYCDGQSYAPTVFGETDSTTGEWKINTSPTITMGSQGFTILKDGNTITDQSSNSNNFTLGGGTLTKTEDCPSNVFATLNPLYKNTTNDTIFANGNTDGSTRDNTKAGSYTTLGMTSGKFYCEVKIRELQGTAVVGVSGRPNSDMIDNKNVGDTTQSAGYRSSGSSEIASATASFGDSYTTNDIIGIAIDVNNSKLYFSKNGVWQNSGVPTSGSTGTGALSMPVGVSSCEDGAYFFGFGDTSTGSNTAPKFSFNFGNGYFATTAVTSAGTNASDNGVFEYDVPTGYTALSTKGLNS